MQSPAGCYLRPMQTTNCCSHRMVVLFPTDRVGRAQCTPAQASSPPGRSMAAFVWELDSCRGGPFLTIVTAQEYKTKQQQKQTTHTHTHCTMRKKENFRIPIQKFDFFCNFFATFLQLFCLVLYNFHTRSPSDIFFLRCIGW